MHIACAADEAYVGHCAAMLHSLLTQNPNNETSVHFLHAPQFPLAFRQQLQAFVERNGGRITFHAIDDGCVTDLPRAGRLPKVMWYRIFLPDLLPEVDRVLYLDADTLVLDELGPLWHTPMGNAYVAAVSNVFEPQFADRPTQLGLEPAQEYFNSGVLLLNLAAMRAAGCTATLVDYAQHGELLWPDQDALNVVLGSRRVCLHPRWNCMNSVFLFPQADDVFGAEAVHAAQTRPAIVHFEGPELAKPWHYLSHHPYRKTYAMHRRATPWPNAVIEGRNWRNRLLRPLPTPVTITILGRWRTLRARVPARLRRPDRF